MFASFTGRKDQDLRYIHRIEYFHFLKEYWRKASIEYHRLCKERQGNMNICTYTHTCLYF